MRVIFSRTRIFGHSFLNVTCVKPRPVLYAGTAHLPIDCAHSLPQSTLLLIEKPLFDRYNRHNR
jgi:hypothetical protein